MGLFVDFLCFYLNLTNQNLKLFCFDVQNNFMFRSGKFSQKRIVAATIIRGNTVNVKVYMKQNSQD